MLTEKISIRRQVFLYLIENPKFAMSELRLKFPNEKQNTLAIYLTQFRKKQLKQSDIIDFVNDNKTEKLIRAVENVQETTEIVKRNVSAKNSIVAAKVNDEVIENAILALYNSGNITINLIRTMIEFYFKVRGNTDKVEIDVDMEMFKKIGAAFEIRK